MSSAAQCELSGHKFRLCTSLIIQLGTMSNAVTRSVLNSMNFPKLTGCRTAVEWRYPNSLMWEQRGGGYLKRVGLKSRGQLGTNHPLEVIQHILHYTQTQLWQPSRVRPCPFLWCNTDHECVLDGAYIITSKRTGTVIDLDGGSTADGRKVQGYQNLKDTTDTFNQVWLITKVGDYYSLVNARSGTYLDLDSGNPADGTKVQGYRNTGGINQRWYFEGNEDGYW